MLGDLYDTVETVKANLSKKYNIPVEHMDINFGFHTNSKFTDSTTLTELQVTVHRGFNVKFKGGNADTYMENADTYKFKSQ